MDVKRANLASGLARTAELPQESMQMEMQEQDMMKQMFTMIQKISSQLDALTQGEQQESNQAQGAMPPQGVPNA